MRAFTQADRFLTDLESRQLKPAYVLVGDEAFFRKRCRDAVLEHLVAPDTRDFGLFEFDLAETSLNEVLDRAQTPSLMAPFQVFFVRGVKSLFGRGSNDDKMAAIEAYCKNPNPNALVIFVVFYTRRPYRVCDPLPVRTELRISDFLDSKIIVHHEIAFAGTRRTSLSDVAGRRLRPGESESRHDQN